MEAQGLVVRAFGQQVLDRFRNPFFRHRLADIAVGHETKRQVRLQPTWDEYQQQFGRRPPLLSEVLELPLPVSVLPKRGGSGGEAIGSRAGSSNHGAGDASPGRDRDVQ